MANPPIVNGPDGFYEPRHQLLEDLINKENCTRILAEEFFDGDEDMVEDNYQNIDEDEYKDLFFKRLGGRNRYQRPYHFVVYGASGYTGSLVLEYIFQNVQGLGTDVTFAIAGRNPDKLRARIEEVKQRIPNDYEPGIIKANIDSAVDIRELCISARCVINIAGPFMLTNAAMLVEGCIEYDCDYVDVNGEVPFTHKLVPYHRWAKDTEVIIVPNAAGAGGLPDVGAFWTAQQLKKANDGAEVQKMHMYLYGSPGGAPSGGTLATRAAMTKNIAEVGAIMGNPFALGGSIENGKRPEDSDKNLNSIEHLPEYGGWTGPFTYAFFETRLIRRSNWLLAEMGAPGGAYGRRLSYLEHLLFPSEEAAKAIAGSATSSKKEEEKLKKENKLYKLGEGLDYDRRKAMWAEYYFSAETVDGAKIRTVVKAGDGYEETARMSVEMALLCSTRREKLPFQGGVLTPSVAGGDLLVDALAASGIKFETVAEDFKPDLTRITSLNNEE